ncbi:MAG TPA: CBS domain-containing protein [Myxococcales bacterium]|nr:CBS domain-containing protein [Myxococcales bacterium]
MKVREIMRKDVISCTDQATLGEVVRLFWEHDIGFVPVLDAATGELIGAITDRDACICAFFEGEPLWNVPVTKAMSSPVIRVAPDDEIDLAEEEMAEAQVHRLPVVEGGKVVGIVSINDIARRAAGSMDETLEQEVALTLGAISQPRAVH